MALTQQVSIDGINRLRKLLKFFETASPGEQTSPNLVNPLLSITIMGTFIILALALYLFLNASRSHSIIYIKSMKCCHLWRLI